MKEIEFKNLIKKDKYQVFLFSSFASIPFNFAVHTWFVTVNKGKVSRWEVLFRKRLCKSSWGYLHLNVFNPTVGTEMFPYYEKLFWKSKLIGYLDGKKGSVAEKMIKYLKNSPKNYPYSYNYSLFKSNSNTFTQMVLNKFPGSKLKLPWNAFGKNHNR